MASSRMIKNAAGRMVPRSLNGESQVPYMGVGKYMPEGRKYGGRISSNASYPSDGNKLVPGLKEALIRSGIKNGMTISTHHHFRNGDYLANEVFDIAHELGITDLRWFPSASFPCHEHLIQHLENGTIERIEGSMNGQIGRAHV